MGVRGLRQLVLLGRTGGREDVVKLLGIGGGYLRGRGQRRLGGIWLRAGAAVVGAQVGEDVGGRHALWQDLRSSGSLYECAETERSWTGGLRQGRCRAIVSFRGRVLDGWHFAQRGLSWGWGAGSDAVIVSAGAGGGWCCKRNLGPGTAQRRADGTASRASERCYITRGSRDAASLMSGPWVSARPLGGGRGATASIEPRIVHAPRTPPDGCACSLPMQLTFPHHRALRPLHMCARLSSPVPGSALPRRHETARASPLARSSPAMRA